MTSPGMNASVSRTFPIGFTATLASSSGAWSSMTMPVTTREPSGTSTRAPTTGRTCPSGTLYVSRPSCGTGTATRISNLERAGRVLFPFQVLGQQLLDQLHVFPDFALRGGIPEQIGGMKRGHQLRAVIVEHPAAQFR